MKVLAIYDDTPSSSTTVGKNDSVTRKLSVTSLKRNLSRKKISATSTVIAVQLLDDDDDLKGRSVILKSIKQSLQNSKDVVEVTSLDKPPSMFKIFFIINFNNFYYNYLISRLFFLQVYIKFKLTAYGLQVGSKENVRSPVSTCIIKSHKESFKESPFASLKMTESAYHLRSSTSNKIKLFCFLYFSLCFKIFVCNLLVFLITKYFRF